MKMDSKGWIKSYSQRQKRSDLGEPSGASRRNQLGRTHSKSEQRSAGSTGQPLTCLCLSPGCLGKLPGRTRHMAAGPIPWQWTECPTCSEQPRWRAPPAFAAAPWQPVFPAALNIYGVKRRTQGLLIPVRSPTFPQRPGLGPNQRDSANEVEGLSGVSWG